MRELLGAACWRYGQAALAGGRLPEAASCFGRAVSEFEAAARESRAAAAALTVRRSTSFVGQAAALLSAGRVEAAQQLFSRSSLSGVHSAEPLARFAASLYSFCDELAGLPREEVIQAAAALREAVLAVRLEVGFYDGRQAVSLAWVSGST